MARMPLGFIQVRKCRSQFILFLLHSGGDSSFAPDPTSATLQRRHKSPRRKRLTDKQSGWLSWFLSPWRNKLYANMPSIGLVRSWIISAIADSGGLTRTASQSLSSKCEQTLRKRGGVHSLFCQSYGWQPYRIGRACRNEEDNFKPACAASRCSADYYTN